jgi:hypothetical protein
MRLMSRAALALAAILVTSPALEAQTSFSVAAGATVPIGSTADGLNTGYNALVALGIKPPLAPLGVRIDGMYNSMDSKVTGVGAFRILAATVNGTLSGVGMPIPMGYLIGGLGMYNSSVSGGSGSETDFGFNIGAGLSFPLTGFSTFLEARFHFVSSEGESMKFVPISFGLKF